MTVVKNIPRYLRGMADGPEITDLIDVSVLNKAASDLEEKDDIITELVGALEEAQYALRSASKTISSHLGSTNKHRYETMQKVDEALTKAKETTK